MQTGLYRYGLFAGALAFAGLPLYLHAPKFFVDEYGLSLTAIGIILLLLRGLDFLQDPLIGAWIDRAGKYRGMIGFGAAAVIAGAMIMLFVYDASSNPQLWFVISMILLFSAYSTLTILFYSQGIAKAEALGKDGHIQVAGWREAGALVGVCIAAVLPTIFASMDMVRPMTAFALTFVIFVAIAAWMMRGEWVEVQRITGPGVRILSDPSLRRLLFIALLNAAPVAVTSNLFLFFVEYRLGAALSAGPFLLLFFLAAAVSVPFWSRCATRYGVKRSILAGMVLAIVTFGFALTLGTGDLVLFAVVCFASGAALGADMTLLPAAFARQLKASSAAGGRGFGLWNFCAKFMLALAAAIVLPSLEWAGFQVGAQNDAQALWVLSLLYAGLPCVLKFVAVGLVLTTQFEENTL
ncbi:MAG: MFS transporter [Pseudomonadota bacterium]